MLTGLLSPTHRSPQVLAKNNFPSTQAPLPLKPLFHAPSKPIKNVASTNYHNRPTLVYNPKPVTLPLQLPQYQPLPPPAVYNPKPVLAYKTYQKPIPNYQPVKPLPSYHQSRNPYLHVKPSPIYQKPEKEEPKPYSYEYGVHNDYSGVHYTAGQVADGSGWLNRCLSSFSF